MKIIDLLTESARDVSIDEALEMAAPFLKKNEFAISHEIFLYRGMTNPLGKEIFVKTTDMDKPRRPRDMPRIVHAIFDKYMEDTFGLKYRSFAKFATGSLKNAETYGTPFIFIPIGDYKFCYSYKVKDPYNDVFASFMDLMRYIIPNVYKSDLEDMANDLNKYSLITNDDEIYDSLTVAGMKKDFHERFPRFYSAYENEADEDEDAQRGFERYIYEVVLPSFKLKETEDLREAAQSMNEVMIDCKSYIMIDATDNNSKKLKDFVRTL